MTGPWRDRSGLPVVALAACLAACCRLHPFWLERRSAGFDALTSAYALFAVLGGITCIAAFVLAVVASPMTGSGPATAVGAVAAVYGLLSGRRVESSAELLAVAIALGVATGLLLAAGLIEIRRHRRSRRWFAAAVTAWSVPQIAGWVVTGWWADTPARAGAVVEAAPVVSAWIVVPAAGLLAAWSVYALLSDQLADPQSDQLADQLTDQLTDRVGASRPPEVASVARSARTSAMTLAGMGVAVASVFAAAIAADLDDISGAWERPLILVGSALSIGLLVAGGVVLGNGRDAGPAALSYTGLSSTALSSTGLSYAGALVAALLAPAVLSLSLARAESTGGISAWPVVMTSAVAVVAGCTVAFAPVRTSLVGPALGVFGSVAAWIMPTHPWLWALAIAPLIAALSITLVGAVRGAASETWFLIGFVAVAASALGSALIPALFGYALTGDLAPVAGGRVVAGLCAVGFVALAALSELVGHRARRRPADLRVTHGTDVTIA